MTEITKPPNSLVGASKTEVLTLAQDLAKELGGSVVDGLVTGHRIMDSDECGTYLAAVSELHGVEIMVFRHGRMNRRTIYGTVSDLASQIRAAHVR